MNGAPRNPKKKVGGRNSSWNFLRAIRVSFGTCAEHALVLQPADTSIGPSRTGQAALTDAESVAAMRINMQLRRHIRPFQGQIYHHAVLGAGHRIVARMHQEDRYGKVEVMSSCWLREMTLKSYSLSDRGANHFVDCMARLRLSRLSALEMDAVRRVSFGGSTIDSARRAEGRGD